MQYIDRLLVLALAAPATWSSQLPQVDAATPTLASTPGFVAIFGANFDALSAVKIEGVPATLLTQTPTTLNVLPAPGTPGWSDVEVTNAVGSTTVFDLLELWPSLGATSTGIGGTLDLELHNSEQNFYMLAFGLKSFTVPFPVYPALHGLLIDPSGGFVILASGLTDALGQAQVSIAVPSDPGLAGVDVHSQGFAQQGSFGSATLSFTNLATVTLAPAPRFVVRSTSYATPPTAPLVVQSKWLVYLADEVTTGPGGTDVNLDGDALDAVAVAVDMESQLESPLQAAVSAAVIGDEVYLAVQEFADGRDWSGDAAQDDFVLLHWSAAAGVVAFVDELDPGGSALPMAAIQGRLYYAAVAAGPGPDETSLFYLDSTAPLTPVAVSNQVGGGALFPLLFDVEDDLLFLYLDESTAAADYNNDADAVDGAVLALLDATDPTARMRNVGLALASPLAPVGARSTGAGDWLVGFLVSEVNQGATNLNDPSSPVFSMPIVPPACNGTPDVDVQDDVLHYLHFASFMAGTQLPVNTGIAGKERIVVTAGHLATLSGEAESSCDLNADGDQADTIARWVAASTPVAPVIDTNVLHAIQTGVGGGSRGLSSLDERYVIVVDEAADSRQLDGKPAANDLVGWIDPVVGGLFTFSHLGSTLSHGTGIAGEPYAGVDWLAAEAREGRLGMAFQESVPNLNLNTVDLTCSFLAKDSDATDVLPVWADFESGPTLDFDGLGYALEPSRAGIVVAMGWVFFRVSETSDNTDYNGDGDKLDAVLFRNPELACGPVFMSTATSFSGPIVESDAQKGGAFVASELDAGVDFDGDGDLLDFVVRYFLF